MSFYGLDLLDGLPLSGYASTDGGETPQGEGDPAAGGTTGAPREEIVGAGAEDDDAAASAYYYSSTSHQHPPQWIRVEHQPPGGIDDDAISVASRESAGEAGSARSGGITILSSQPSSEAARQTQPQQLQQLLSAPTRPAAARAPSSSWVLATSSSSSSVVTTSSIYADVDIDGNSIDGNNENDGDPQRQQNAGSLSIVSPLSFPLSQNPSSLASSLESITLRDYASLSSCATTGTGYSASSAAVPPQTRALSIVPRHEPITFRRVANALSVVANVPAPAPPCPSGRAHPASERNPSLWSSPQALGTWYSEFSEQDWDTFRDDTLSVLAALGGSNDDPIEQDMELDHRLALLIQREEALFWTTDEEKRRRLANRRFVRRGATLLGKATLVLLSAAAGASFGTSLALLKR